MKHLLLTTIAAVVLVVGCGESQSPEPPTAKAPDISIYNAVDRGNIEAIKQHIAAGTDVNVKNEFGLTPLHRAASRGHKEIAELLIAKGADVNAKDKWGWTPLSRAAKNGEKETAELLIANGADVSAKNDYGETPLDWANFYGSWQNPTKRWMEGDHNREKEIADLIRKHGGKTGEELKAAEPVAEIGRAHV